MEYILIIMILMFNVFSVFLSVRMLKGYEGSKIITIVGIGEVALFILCNIIYAITSGGIPPEIHQASKWYIIFTMLPVNVLTVFCPIANEINKKSFNEVTEEKYKKRIMLYILIALIVFIIQILYVKNIQLGITRFKN